MNIVQKFFLYILISWILIPVTIAQSGRIPVQAENGMVVSSHYLASRVGTKILQQGGNAVDATIATAFALAVTLPSAGNLGGGGFMVVHGSDGHQTTFNYREKAPLAATPTMFLEEDGQLKKDSNHKGALSVGVPGTVAGLYLAHQKLGHLPWESLVTPAIALAEYGFPSSYDMVWFQEWVEDNITKYPSTATVFLKNGKEVYKPGETWIQKDLAETLKRIKDRGADGFYKGKTARLIEDFMIKNGGLITQKDLELYEAEELTPIKGTYRNYKIIGMPPPSSGGVAVIEMLNILEGFDIKELGHNSAIFLHVLTEAMRRAFADRALHLGDPDFNPHMPLETIIDKKYAGRLKNSIEMGKASKSDSANFSRAHLKPESPETTHVSVIDKDGNAVSMTYTLEASYGSRMVVEGAGFLLNNEMGDFNPVPGYTDSKGLIGTPPNLIAPQKRMLSSMSPTIVLKNGTPIIIIGSPGGKSIINTVLQVIVNVLDHDMNIAQAIESPRIHHQWLPDVTSIEKYGFSQDTRELYENMGHTIKEIDSQGRAMGIYIDPISKIIYGSADSRSYDGKAVGY